MNDNKEEGQTDEGNAENENDEAFGSNKENNSHTNVFEDENDKKPSSKKKKGNTVYFPSENGLKEERLKLRIADLTGLSQEQLKHYQEEELRKRKRNKQENKEEDQPQVESLTHLCDEDSDAEVQEDEDEDEDKDEGVNQLANLTKGRSFVSHSDTSHDIFNCSDNFDRNRSESAKFRQLGSAVTLGKRVLKESCEVRKRIDAVSFVSKHNKRQKTKK